MAYSKKDYFKMTAAALLFFTANGSLVASGEGYLTKKNLMVASAAITNSFDSLDFYVSEKEVSYEAKKADVQEGINKCTDDSCRMQKINEGLEDLADYWYGTDYDLNGCTKIPGKGSIACGFFVSTLLKDVGYKHDRITVGRLVADDIIKKFCDMNTYKWYSYKSPSVLEEHTKKYGEGFYILGLDKHVAFINYDGKETYVIHSNPMFPSKVVKHKVTRSPIVMLSDSKVIAKLSLKNY